MKSFLERTIRKFFYPAIKKSALKFHDAFYGDAFNKALTVFLYHDVSDSPSEFSRKFNLNVPPDLFKFQLDFIQKEFTVISPKLLTEETVLPSNAALVTFDDGFKSVFGTALPFLEENGIPSLTFLNMAPIKGGVFWAGLLTYLCEQSDFMDYLNRARSIKKNRPVFLNCSEEIVEGFLSEFGDVKDEVFDYVGEFASIDDLNGFSQSKLIFFGNHLYDHFVPNLMSDDAFIKSFNKNKDEIKIFPNFINMFSFPFGQPDTCFQGKHVELLKKEGVDKIFMSSESVNYHPDHNFLDRISLSQHHDSAEKIKFQIIKHRLPLRGKLN